MTTLFVLCAQTPTPIREIIRERVPLYCSTFASAGSQALTGIMIDDRLIRDDARQASQLVMNEGPKTGILLRHISDGAYGILRNAELIQQQIDALRAVLDRTPQSTDRAALEDVVRSAQASLDNQKFIANRFIDESERVSINLMYMGTELERNMNANALYPIIQSPPPSPDANLLEKNPVVRPRSEPVNAAAYRLGEAERALSSDVITIARQCKP